MKFVIAVDLEGVAGVVGFPGKGLTLENCPDEYRAACREAVRAVNAAARALFDGGASHVVIWDNHASGVNLPVEDLDARTEIMRGAFAERWEGIEEFDGALLIGYHAMAGTPRGILNHSFSSAVIQSIRVNGSEVGEISVDAHFAGVKGIPVIFVESDRAGVTEANRFLPWARTVVTKEGYGRNAARLYHPLKIERETYDMVLDAVKHIGDMGLYWFESPMEVEIRYMRMEDAHRNRGEHGELTDEYTVRRYMDELRLF